ncbi:hypothetical protein GGQ18_003190 [Salinibacter ruber]|uniref:hypothetical protein n=1 Tax=Salinibacter ruber TaxID=146919 RepID=UPI001620F700|nr:hypothetical protein [Salinibacter ruber]MBB4070575.1 hypothetical protein [Salinibacter ruber]
MARILHDGRTYHPYEYDSEEEFEEAVIGHSHEIFGPDTVYFDIKKRLENENVLTIPDGYLLDFSFQHSPRLYIIENELVEHDPFRHIGQQLLKFATAYEESRHKLKQALSDEIQADSEKRTFIEERAAEADIRNVDVLLDEVIYGSQAAAIVVIDEITSDLENVLGQLTMGTDVVQLKTYVREGDLIHHVRPFQQDVRSAAGDEESIDPEELDTVVVPARREGFEETFLGEDCWYKIGMASSMVEQVEHIAAYRTAPVSAITHCAEVASIEKYQDTGKYILHFKEPAEEIDRIPLPDGHEGIAPQGRQYTTFTRLIEAETLDEVFL